jgi:hypothetical protein
MVLEIANSFKRYSSPPLQASFRCDNRTCERSKGAPSGAQILLSVASAAPDSLARHQFDGEAPKLSISMDVAHSHQIIA